MVMYLYSKIGSQNLEDAVEGRSSTGPAHDSPQVLYPTLFYTPSTKKAVRVTQRQGETKVAGVGEAREQDGFLTCFVSHSEHPRRKANLHLK